MKAAMNRLHRALGMAALLLLPALAAGYAYTAPTPDGQGIQQNQTSGPPIIWYVPQQSFVFNFEADFNTQAISAMNEWNAVGTPMQWHLGTAAATPCNSSDNFNSAGWSNTTCDNKAFGDAVAVTKRSYEKIGGTWYLTDADIVFDHSLAWQPQFSGPLRNNEQDFHRVILHELGHALGLDHPDDAGQAVTAIMNSKTGEIDSLQQDDKLGINKLYPGSLTGAGNTANQITPSRGGIGDGCWLMPLLALAARLRRRTARHDALRLNQ